MKPSQQAEVQADELVPVPILTPAAVQALAAAEAEPEAEP